MHKNFDTVLFVDLHTADAAALDALPYGVIGFQQDTRVALYNAFEASSAGLTVHRVLGKHFFEEIAPCMNNALVAQRFVDNDELDEIVPYMLTWRMRPTPVRLRLLKSPTTEMQYVLVERQPVEPPVQA